MRDCPCTPDCENRSVTCHSTCEDYKEFDRKCEEIRQRRYLANQSKYYSKTAEKLVRKRKENH